MAAVFAPRVRIDGEAAQHIAAYWRLLPAGESYRCHIPPFGLRFFNEGEVLCQASPCWECNNIFGDVGGDPLAYGFDAEASASRALLRECRRALGEIEG